VTNAFASKPNPWLSILIPVYQVDEYLPACLESIVTQAVDGVEVVIVLDGYAGPSAQIIEDWRARHPTVMRIFAHATNRGVSAARNTLLEHARGDYLWFVDPDDLMEPGAMPALKTIVETHSADLVMCDFRVIREGNHSLKNSIRILRRYNNRARTRDLHVRSFAGQRGLKCVAQDDLVGGMFTAGHMYSWSKVVRRAAWPASLRFPEGRVFEDLAVFPRLALAIDSWVYSGEVWIAYRQREGSILSTLSVRQLDDWMAALAGYPTDLADAKKRFQRDTLFKVADFQVRSLHYRAKKHREIAGGVDAKRTLVDILSEWENVSPLSLNELRWAYFRRLRFKQLARLLAHGRI
jgi:glycosyltransferase involved in cell wall biosynthesis